MRRRRRRFRVGGGCSGSVPLVAAAFDAGAGAVAITGAAAAALDADPGSWTQILEALLSRRDHGSGGGTAGGGSGGGPAGSASASASVWCGRGGSGGSRRSACTRRRRGKTADHVSAVGGPAGTTGGRLRLSSPRNLALQRRCASLKPRPSKLCRQSLVAMTCLIVAATHWSHCALPSTLAPRRSCSSW